MSFGLGFVYSTLASVRIQCRASILALATHNDSQVQKFCPTTIRVKWGQIAAVGETKSVLAWYHDDIG